MKTIMMAFVLCLTISTQAQNGGQYAENNSVKIQQLVSHVSGKIVVEVTNKQTCPADIRITFGNTSRVKNVPGLGTDTFQIVMPSNGKVRVKTETNCGAADFGQVELTLIAALPISFVDVSGRWLNENTIQLSLKLGSVSGENTVKIHITGKYGKVYPPVLLTLPDGTASNSTYTATVKYTAGQWTLSDLK